MNLTTFISIFFFVCSNLYLLMAFYTYKISPEIKNKIFSICCILLAIWAFGFAFSNQAIAMEEALFWRRISAIGWGLFYGAFLHFNILLTSRKDNEKMHLLRLALYTPGILIVLAYSIYSPIAKNQYDLQRISTGWVNHSINNYLDVFFNFYYIVFLLSSIILIIKWGISGSAKEKKSAMLLCSSILIATVLGSITDIVLTSLIPGVFPQTAPVVILIPILSIFFLIKKMRFISERKESFEYFKGFILDISSKERMLNYMSLFLFLGGSFVIMASYFIFGDNLITTLFIGWLCWLLAFINILVININLSINSKGFISSIIMLLAILMLIIRFSIYSSVTVWALPLLLLPLLIIFDCKWLLFFAFIASEVALMTVWLIRPNQMVFIDSGDHIARVLILGLSMIIATTIINLVHIRLNESDYRTRIQKMLSQIAQKLINTDSAKLDEEYNYVLQLLGRFFDLEYAFLAEKSDNKFIFKNEWLRFKELSISMLDKKIQVEEFPYLYAALNENNALKLFSNHYISKEINEKFVAYNEISEFESLLVPIKSEKDLLGFIGLTYNDKKNIEHDIDSETLEILGQIFYSSFEKKIKEQKIYELAVYDQLTKIPNKALFNDILIKEISLASRSGKMLGLIFLDIDNFKAVNDTLGHDTGDVLIQQVAHRLSKNIRKHDTVARFGGDEFLVLLTNISDQSDLESKVITIINTFCDPFWLNNQEYFVTCSAGVSVYPIDGENPDMLVKNADVAMYTSKSLGKNKYSYCTSMIKADIAEKIELTNQLYRALERNELEVYYQPQICVEDKDIVSFEALLRWNHPDKGILLPCKFIALAESTRLIKPIGSWVMQTACKQITKWNMAGFGPFRIAINVSIIQLLDKEILDDLKIILEENKMDPSTIVLEITESIAANESLDVLSMLVAIKELGVLISIDDFGTEYSSLSRLKTLPVDQIKMDMQFVHSISKSNKDDAIARILIQLAKNLNLKIIAEGIENEMQFKFLSFNGCDEVQGYYFYHPMPADEVEKIMLQSYETS